MHRLTSGVRRALAAHWRRKVVLSVALSLLFCIPYFTLQHIVLFPVRTLPLSAVDAAIPFSPHWVWVYQSVYLLVSFVPWLADRPRDLDRYARGFLLQASLGFAVFLLVPVAGPRPAGSPADPMFRALVSYDSPLNSFPSLHVGLAVYTVLVAASLSRGRIAPVPRAAAVAGLTVWCIAIAFSAIAIRQHYAVDLPAGALLAWLCHRWTWPDAGSRTALVDSGSHVRVDLRLAFERSAHGEAPGTRVSAGPLHSERSWSGPIPAAADACRQSPGGGGPRIAPPAEGDLRTGRS